MASANDDSNFYSMAKWAPELWDLRDRRNDGLFLMDSPVPVMVSIVAYLTLYVVISSDVISSYADSSYVSQLK